MKRRAEELKRIEAKRDHRGKSWFWFGHTCTPLSITTQPIPSYLVKVVYRNPHNNRGNVLQGAKRGQRVFFFPFFFFGCTILSIFLVRVVDFAGFLIRDEVGTNRGRKSRICERMVCRESALCFPQLKISRVHQPVRGLF